MPDSSVFQNDFRGGEWSSTSQARSDDPAYKTALKVGQNMIPIEEGSLVRRPGFQRMGPTRNRLKPKLLDFMSSSTCSFVCEFTNNNLQFWSGTLPIFTSDGAVTTVASYATLPTGKITLTFAAYPGSPQWVVGDIVMLKFEGAGLTVAQEAFCRGRFFQITARNTGAHTITIGDDQGNPFLLSAFPTGSLVGVTVYRVLRFTTTYGTSALPSLRLVQAQTQAFILSQTVTPQVITVNEPNAPNDPTFTFGAATFLDGPYLDPQSDIGTLSALSGSVTFTPSGPSYTFVASDVGRMIRVYTQPPAWNSGTTYTNGQFVTYNGLYWQSIASGLYASSNVNVIPGTPLYTAAGVQVPLWVPAPQAYVVVWGTISAQAGTNCTFTIQLVDGVTAPPAGNVVQQWTLGVYTTATFPTCGVYYEGRIHLGGAVANRGDASMANGVAQSPLTNQAGIAMSPTDATGNVNDNCGIAYVLNSDHLNNFEWMIGDQQGIVIGTLEGEWLLAASALGDPITPTSIQVHLATRYGDAFVEPRRAGIAMLFVQRYGRRILEYLADTFSQRFSGLHVNDHSKHMTISGVNEMRYQEETAPLIWTAQNDGSLASCLYRRRSRFVTENPLFNGWMRHQHGAPGGTIASIVTLPAGNDLGDNLYAAVGTQYGYWMEVLRELPETTDTALENRYLDSRPGGTSDPILAKCGSLLPSTGFSIPPSTYTPSSWSSVTSLPGRSATPPGTTLAATPPVSGGLAFVQASRFNGASYLYNLLAGITASSGSLSVWFWLDNDTSGAIYNTGPPPNGGSPLFQDQAASGYFEAVSGGNPLGGTWSSFSGLVGGWNHLMISWINHQDSGSVATCYINDTAIGGGTQDTFLSPTGNCSFARLAFGGHSFYKGGTSITEGSYFAGTWGQIHRGDPQAPGPGEGLTGDVYDLWMLLSTSNSQGGDAASGAIDWSVSANRYAFQNANGALTRYAPCDIGTQGQKPLTVTGLTQLSGGATLSATVPTVYCTGPPADFNINRANGANCAVWNQKPSNGNYAYILLDPAKHALPVL